MKNKTSSPAPFNASEIQLIEQLREQPQMLARLQSILELTRNADGPLMTADQVENLLMQELRLLGNTSLTEWAGRAEERVSQELQSQDATVRSRKKKP